MAYGVQLMWQRSGKSGATPPMRLPFGKNKNKPLSLPVLGPWQMMIAMWLGRQIWSIYGDQVKSKLRQTNHPIANHVHDLLPDTGKTSNQSTPAAAVSASPVTTPSTPAPRQTPQYGTQVLTDTQNGSGNLPPGSVLSSLRGQS